MTFAEISKNKYLTLGGKPDYTTEWTRGGFKHVEWVWNVLDYVVEFKWFKDRIDNWKVLRRGILKQ